MKTFAIVILFLMVMQAAFAIDRLQGHVGVLQAEKAALEIRVRALEHRFDPIYVVPRALEST